MPICTNRRNFLKQLAAGGAGLAAYGCGSPPPEPEAPQKPNIIFLMADDMGYGDLGCYNADSKIPTPNMDRLAAEGMRFTDAHSGSAVCTPTRYGVVTGRYAWRSRLKRGVLSGYSRALIEPDRMTVAEMLRENGYHTGVVGKWHLGLNWQTISEPKTWEERDTANAHQGATEFAKPEGLEIDFTKPVTDGPATQGFAYSYIIPASLDMAPYVYLENNKCVKPATVHEPGRSEQEVFWRPGEAAEGFDFFNVLPNLTEHAVQYIEDRAVRDADKPFFLYFPLAAPHWPWVPTEEFVGKSEAGKYGDFVNQVDAMVGKIMDTLDRKGIAENTLLIVSSDNGAEWDPRHIQEFGHYANHASQRGKKRDTWEGGHREPFIARWPARIAAGSTSDQTICLTDIMATAADIAGIELPAGAAEDSVSILPALLGEDSGPLREATVHHSVNGTFAIRQGKWKFIDGQGSGIDNWQGAKPGDPPGQLYDIEADRHEDTNLYNDHPELIEKLKALLEKYKEQGYSRLG
jgi:arylsulfatase A